MMLSVIVVIVLIIATGARARDLPFAPADGKRVWTYRHAMTPTELLIQALLLSNEFVYVN